MKLHQKFAVITASAALSFAVLEDSPVLAATFTVTNIADGGAGSLTDAIQLANSTSGDDIIDFMLGIGPQTITLNNHGLDISSNINIVGSGANRLTIRSYFPDPINSGGNVFNISQGATVELSRLSITGGQDTFGSGADGFGIDNAGKLTVTNSTFFGNQGTRYGGGFGIQNESTGVLTVANSTIRDSTGGIANSGTATLINDIISGNSRGAYENGGGISSYGGTMAIRNSTISGNSAFSGGGIAGSNIVITNSTISGNAANNEAGGIAGSNIQINNSTISGNRADFEGGGIYGSNIAVTNSTISGNSANAGFGGGIGGSNIAVTNSTISGNSANGGFGSGILIDGPGGINTVGNTIIAGNAAGDSEVDGNFTSLGYNLIGNGAASTGFTAVGDQVGTDAAPIDPKLGPLQNNGGPTQTQALLPGSPAIDAANPNSFPPTDQRGVSRPQGKRADIGAFELQSPQPVPEPVAPLGLSVLGLGFFLKRISGYKSRQIA